MSVSPETDPDGVDQPTESEVHGNVRESAEGVEAPPPPEHDAGELIGGGAAAEPVIGRPDV